jgi:predicted kinase
MAEKQPNPKKLKVTVLKGLPGSGKSTWAREQVLKSRGEIKRINKDDLREMLDAGEWSRGNERFILAARDALILAAVDRGKNVLVDDTNLAPEHEARIRELVRGKAEVDVRFFEADVDECIKRDLKRTRSVGERVIRQMYEQFLKPQPELYNPEPELPAAVICDLDGTLAHLNGRNPYDATDCEQDELNHVVAGILRMHEETGVLVVLLSGREDEYRAPTMRWLERHGVKHAELHMRATADNRKDSIIKRELFDREIRHRYRVLYVLDDRNQVVEMWRAMGLICLQVAPGDF